MQDLTLQHLTGLRALVLPILLGLLAFGVGPQAAQAQTAQSDRDLPSTWSENVGAQLAGNLKRAPNEQIRTATMRLIIRLKATHGEAIDLSTTAPVLLELSRTAETESQRILAITALYETGDTQSLRALAQQVRTAPPSRVRAHAVRILAAHQQANQAG